MPALWATQLIAELDAADQRTNALTAGLTEEQLNWQSSAGGVEHRTVSGASLPGQ